MFVEDCEVVVVVVFCVCVCVCVRAEVVLCAGRSEKGWGKIWSGGHGTEYFTRSARAMSRNLHGAHRSC